VREGGGEDREGGKEGEREGGREKGGEGGREGAFQSEHPRRGRREEA
jgi:hypothetical protein